MQGTMMSRRKRKRRPIPRKPEFTIDQILAWADTYHAKAGRWPTAKSGRILDSLGEKWIHVDTALRKGHRGLPGGSSMARFLAERRGVRNLAALPPLRIRQILGWADAHHRRFNEWPTPFSGPVADAPGEIWSAVKAALANGRRGLRGGSSLAQLLANHRGVRNPK